MNPADVRKLYTLASAIDPRMALTDLADLALRLEAWSLVFADIPCTLTEAKTALLDHYQTSPDSVMPADIIRRLTPEPPTTPGILTQQPPCDVCGLQPTHRTHDHDHPYQPAFPEPSTNEIQDTPPAIDWHHELQQARERRP